MRFAPVMWLTDRVGDWLQEERHVRLPAILVVTTNCFGVTLMYALVRQIAAGQWLLVAIYIAVSLVLVPILLVQERRYRRDLARWSERLHPAYSATAIHAREAGWFYRTAILTITLMDVALVPVLGADYSLLYGFVCTIYFYSQCILPKTPKERRQESYDLALQGGL